MDEQIYRNNVFVALVDDPFKDVSCINCVHDDDDEFCYSTCKGFSEYHPKQHGNSQLAKNK